MLPIFFICGLFLFFVFAYIFSKPIKAATAPSIITYQGKLLIGSRLATTTQSMYFILYDAASAGTALYTASGTIGSPGAVSVTPAQGLFSINLGDTGTNSIDPAIFQNNSSVYLEVRIGADTLTPRKRITSVPYAFNARYLDGVGVNTLSSTTYIPKSDSSGNFTFNSTTISTSTILSSLNVFGSSSFTTITAGIWNGTVISSTYGGTGQNTQAWTGLVRITAGTWSTTTISLATDVTGVLPIANGGTNSSTLAANGSVIYSDGTRYNAVAVGSTGQILQSTGSGAPVWVSTSSLGFSNYTSWTLATSTDDIGYSVTSGVKVVFSGINGVTTTRSNNTLSVGLTNSGITAGTYGSASAVPVLTIDAFGRVTANSTSSIAIAGSQITSGVVSSSFGGTGQNTQAWTGLVRVTGGVWSTTTIALGSDVSGVLAIANGGTNSSTLAANGSVIYSDGTRYNAVAVGSAGQLLQSTGSGAPVWVNTSSLGFSNYTSWFLATSTDDSGYSVTSGVKVILSGINGITTTRSNSSLSIGLTNSGITAGTYGSASAVPVLTIDAFGRVIANTTSSIAINGNQITSGVVSSTNGGTGQNSQAWTGLVRVTNGVWSTTTIGLTTDVTGVLPVANGGTNSSTLAANGSVIYSDGTRYNAVAVGTSGQILQSTGSSAPTWVNTSSLGFPIYNNWLLATSTDDSGYSVTSGVKVILSGINGVTTTRSNNSLSVSLTNSGITAGTYGSASAVPVFTIDAFGRVTANSTSSIAINGNQITSGVVSSTNGGTGQNSQAWTGLVRVIGGVWSTTTIALTSDVTGVLPIANGGTNSSTIAANGSVIYSDGTRYNATAIGTSGQILQSTGSGAPVWVSTSSLGFVNLQGSTPGTQQTGHFNISGTGIIGDDLAVGTSTIISRLTVQGDGTRNPFSILSSTASSMFTILTNGNVGINSSSPKASLSLVGTTDIDPFNIVSSAGSSLLMITANGKVGIGTSTPAQRLSVVGNISNIIDSNTEISQINSVFLQPIFPLSVFVSGRYAYVAGDLNKLAVVDISDPSNPALIASTTVGVSPWSIYVSGRYAYTANSTSNTISVVDISNPSAPTQVATTSVGSDPYSVYVSGQYAYTANRGSNSISVVDISNPAAPRQIATTSVGSNPTSIAVSGRYAYTANNGSSNISVVDVSNPTAPLQLATVTVGVTPRSIAVSGRYAYVVSQSGIFSVVDISNPSAPTQVATTSAGTLGLYLSGRYAYVTNHSSDSVIVVDVSNPLAPTPVKTAGVEDAPYSIFVSGRYAYVGNYGTGSLSVVDISGTEVSSLIAHSAEFGNLQSRNDIFAQGNIMAGTSLTVGSGGIFSQGGLSIFASSTGATSSILSISTPQAPNTLKVLANGNIGIGTSTPAEKLSVVGNISNITDTSTTISVVSSTGTMTGPRSVFVSGRYAYVVGDQATSNFRVFDVTTFSTTTILVASTTLPGAPRSVYVSGQYAYVALTTSNTIGVVDITNPSRPTLVATTSVGTDPQTVFVSGKYLYVTNATSNTLSIIDISNPRSPVLMSSVSSGGTNPYGLYVAGRYAYVTHLVSGHITAIDISNPSSPVVAGSAIMSSGQSQSIYVSGRYAYVAAGLGDLIFIVDFANPASPVLIASTTTGSGTVPRSIFVSGRYAYVGNQTNSISIIDVANPYRPQRLQNVSVSGAPINIFVSGRYAYVANNTGNTLSVLDISGAEVSSLIAHSAEVGNLQSRNDLFAQGNIMAGTSLMAGAGGIMSQGALSIFSSSTGPTTSVFSIDTVASSSIIKVLANGNIGIGTSTPASALHIGGNGALSFGTIPALTGAIRLSTNTGINVRNAANTADMNLISLNSGNQTIIGNATGASLFSSDVGFTSDNTFDIGGGTRSPRNIFAKSTLTAGGATSFATLSVQGSGTANPFTILSSTASTMFTILTNGRIGINSSTPVATLGIQGTAGSDLFEVASSTGASLLRILQNGFVGINNGAPTAKLTVTDEDGGDPMIRIRNFSEGVAGAFSSAYINEIRLSSDVGGRDHGFLLSLAENSASRRVLDIYSGLGVVATFGSNGRIGIGTTTPISKLAIQGTGTENPFSILSSTASSMFTILTNGNVGINTSSPVATLGIQGVAGSNPLEIASSTGASLFRVLTNGNVGINTSTPAEKLSVVGNISNIIEGNTTISQIASVGVGSDPQSVFVSGRYAYTANNSSNTISVIDISNPAVPVQIATTSVGAGPRSIYVSGRYAYTANNTSGTISVIDISNPALPRHVATTSVGTGPHSIYVSGRYAYVVNASTDNMSVVDISNPLAPVQIATAAVGNNPKDIFVSGRYAYVTNVSAGTMSIVDISNPSLPSQVSTVTIGIGSPNNTPQSIYVSGRYAYVGATGAGVPGILSIIDISNAASPVQIATTSAGNDPDSLFVSGRYVYAVNSADKTLMVFDVSSSSAPTLVKTAAISATAPSFIFVSGRYAYVADSTGNALKVLDISGTEVSSLMAHSAEVGQIQSRNDIFAQGNIMAGTSLLVGAGGIMSQGSLSIFASTTGATSSIFNVNSGERSNIFTVLANGRAGINTSSPISTFAIQGISNINPFQVVSSTGASMFTVLANGNVGIGTSNPTESLVVGGNLDVNGSIRVNLDSPANADFAICHTTNGAFADETLYDCNGSASADYMEMYPADTDLEMGDIVVFSNNFVTSSDGNTVPKLTKSTAAYQAGLVGIISDSSQAGDFNSIGHNIAPEDNPMPLALTGRVLIKVTNTNGNIAVGDKLTSSHIPGVAMKATGEGPTIAIAMGNYTSSQVGTVMGFVNTGWNNAMYRALTVDTIGKTITFGTSSDPYDLKINGNISLLNTNIINQLSFATSTLFESSVASFSGARAFTFNAINFTGPLADNYIISLRANNNSVFSVAANGDVHALGNYYGASAVLGTSTNPGDLAERVDIAMDDTVEAGDVVMVDKNAPDTYRRSDTAYEESVAGVISTNPTIVVGNGRTDYTAVMAMVGRVPVKVSGENGAIARGDLLVAASRPGYAMKYDAAKDKNNKMVGVIGVALEPLQASSTGKILSLIRTGWVYNRDKDIENLKNDIEQMAVVQGINLAASSTESDSLSVEDNNNQLVYTGGNLDLQNNALINVASILGKNNKWKIDEFGNLIQKIATAAGDKEIYGLQSTAKQEIVISGTSTLQNGTRRVVLTDLDQAVIDKTVPLKISITMSGETNGFYVAERSYDSFVVKENGNGQSNAEFDWIVIAKVGSGEGNAPAPEVPVEPSTDTPDSSGAGTQSEPPSSTPPTETSEPAPAAPIVEEVVESSEETVSPVEETISDTSTASSTP